jgi:zinc transport system substrate-binding protein
MKPPTTAFVRTRALAAGGAMLPRPFAEACSRRHREGRAVNLIAAACLALLVAAAGCSENSKPSGSAKPVVFACIAPHGYFARRIAGSLVDVQVLVRAGANPHTYEPPAAQMVALSRAGLYFRAGMPFETALCDKLAGMTGGPRIIDLLAGMDLLGEDEHSEHAEHDNGAEQNAGHDHGLGKDPHVWLAPKLAAKQAAIIRDALCQAYPAHADEFRRNAAALTAELEELDAKVAAALAPVKGRTFFVFHPAFGYFAAAYGLHQQAVETGGKSPSLKDIADLIDKAKAEKVRVIFVQPQFSTQAATTIANEIGGVVVPIDDLAEDYMTNMQAMAEKVHSALSGVAGGK